jgi:hypothetical protein
VLTHDIAFMSQFAAKKPISRKAFDLALDRLEKEAQRAGRSLRDQLMISVGQYWKAQHSGPDSSALQFQNLPVEFFRELVNLGAGRSKRTPGQQIKKVLRPWVADENPKQLQNWYGQIYGEFAHGTLSDVMREVLLFAMRKDEKLIQRIHSAVLCGEVKTLEQIARCVALIHGVRYEGTGQAARVASQNKKLIGIAYLHLFELDQKPPTPFDIRIDLARDLCLADQRNKRPKFSDIWYLLRSGTTDDKDEVGPNSRYEVIGTRYIKKVLKSLKWPFRPSPRGHITVQAVKTMLDRAAREYLDDSETVLSDGR